MTTSTTLITATPHLGAPDQPNILPISRRGRFAQWNVERKARAAEESKQSHVWRDRMASRNPQAQPA